MMRGCEGAFVHLRGIALWHGGCLPGLRREFGSRCLTTCYQCSQNREGTAMSQNVAELIESIALLESKLKDLVYAPSSVFAVVYHAQRYLNCLLMEATKGTE
jgi:hypothetical protein